MYKGQKRYFKDVAEFIKKEFDAKYGGSFHVIVGNYLIILFITGK